MKSYPFPMYIGELNGTPVGDLRLAASDRGLVAVEWARPQQLPIVVVPGRGAPQERSLQRSGAAAHERIVDDLARLGEPLDKEAG